MTRIIVTIVLLVCSTIFGQTAYEQGMQKAFALWGEGKNQEASAIFERIAAAESDKWLPNYYVALVNTTTAFSTKDKVQVEGLLQKAQTALDIELKKQPNNPELLVMQGMIYSAWIAFDPMTNGMKLSGKTMELYTKAENLAPENPRVVLSKTDFEMGSARFFGTDTKPLCEKMKKAIELFATFKPESPLHPNWGQDRAQKVVAECN
jgi:tetratricopeptide (TPR) repeat protein